jgi:hypothetical protein
VRVTIFPLLARSQSKRSVRLPKDSPFAAKAFKTVVSLDHPNRFISDWPTLAAIAAIGIAPATHAGHHSFV